MTQFEDCLNKAHSWLKNTQISENVPDYQMYYRQMNKVWININTSFWMDISPQMNVVHNTSM